MKNLLSILFLFSSLTVSAEVKTLWDSIKETPKDYLIPCGVLMVGGAVVSEDGLALGALGCAATTGIIYNNKKDVQEMEHRMKMMMNDNLKLGMEKIRTDLKGDLEGYVINEGLENIANKFKLKVLEDVQKELNLDREELKIVLEKFSMNLEEYKSQVFNEVQLRMNKVSEDVSEEVQAIMTNPEFLSVLEKKIANSMKDLAEDAILRQREDIIKDCVKRTILEIHEKKILIAK